MRILYLHQHFSLPAGSTATRSHAMARALIQRGHQVTLACGRYRGAVTGLEGPFARGRREGVVQGLRIVEFAIPYANEQGLGARARSFLRFAWRAMPLALERGIDLVIASSTPLTVALPALVARRWRGTPFLFEIRDPWPEAPRALTEGRHGSGLRLAFAGMDLLADAACRRAQAVVALTPGMAATARAHGAAAERLFVVPNGCDLDLFGPHIAPWRPGAAGAGECLAVYAGTHGAANGLGILLDAAGLLLRHGERRLRLVLVGEGAEKPGLMRRAAAEGLVNVTFLDAMPKPRLAGLLAGAQVGLQILAPIPAFAAWAAPNKLMDCLAAGLPVVTNQPGEVADLLAGADCGIAVGPRDAAALAEALAESRRRPRRAAAHGRGGAAHRSAGLGPTAPRGALLRHRRGGRSGAGVARRLGAGVTELHLVAAARPNLPKLAALWHALPAAPRFRPVLVHTGQHHDAPMFADHLAALDLPAPEVALGIAGGGHAALTGRSMMALAELWEARRPALVVVVGDVDGTLAAALAARKLAIPVAHLEAGLRNPDRDMPEEINRRAVDAIACLLWAPDAESAARLLAEGHDARAVCAVGNALADSLFRALPAARARALPAGLAPGGFGLVTLHRPANVDDAASLAALLEGLGAAARDRPLLWPLHPRTAARLRDFGLATPPGLRLLPPLAHGDFLALLCRAGFVATDSGGVSEEATMLDIPCLTLRPATERPVTLQQGSARLVAPSGIGEAVAAIARGDWPRARPVPLWDGRAGERMVAHLCVLARMRPPPLVLMLSAAHPPDDVRVVVKQGAALALAGWPVRHLSPGTAGGGAAPGGGGGDRDVCPGARTLGAAARHPAPRAARRGERSGRAACFPSRTPGWRRCWRRGGAGRGWCSTCMSTTPPALMATCPRRCDPWRARRCGCSAGRRGGGPMRWSSPRTGWRRISGGPRAACRCATTPCAGAGAAPARGGARCGCCISAR